MHFFQLWVNLPSANKFDAPHFQEAPAEARPLVTLCEEPRVAVSVLHGEVAHSSKPFENDPYGCAESQLRAKRNTRNPFRRHVGYTEGCPEIRHLLEHCGTSRYSGPLPWSMTLGDDDDEAKK